MVSMSLSIPLRWQDVLVSGNLAIQRSIQRLYNHHRERGSSPEMKGNELPHFVQDSLAAMLASGMSWSERMKRQGRGLKQE